MNNNTINLNDAIITKVLDGYDKKRKSDDWVGIIIHHTGVGGRTHIDEPLWSRLNRNIANYLGKKDSVYVSAHFQIGRSGEVTQIVNPDYYIAYHAGRSNFWHPVKRKMVTSWNKYSIGIELLGDGAHHEYTEEQYKALGALTGFLYQRYPTINPQCIVGHEMISPGRKTDPGESFDWRRYYFEITSQVPVDSSKKPIILS